ncbi:PaaI family thioesterase [Roseateles sp. DB2]|uniref:PaaI family thioesterase n=1 Tax=Roseateles sp. DB2 TaxID=3453717 RepID=UPI003EEB7195
MNGAEPPAGYEPLFRTSPFLDATGPWFHRRTQEGFVVGLRIDKRHTNNAGTAHGGLIATLADIALGYVTASSQQVPLRMTTTHLSLDYVGGAALGAWLEARVSIVKVGSRLAVANAIIMADDTPVASAHASFLVLGAAD